MNSDKIKKRLQHTWSSASRPVKLSKSLAYSAGFAALATGTTAAAEKPNIQYDPVMSERRNVSKLAAKFVLKRAGTLYINFAQHRSHSSHSSHRSHSSHYSSSTGSGHSSHSSHYSSSTVYTPPPSSTPSYKPPAPVYIPPISNSSSRKKNTVSRPDGNSSVSRSNDSVDLEIPEDNEIYDNEATPTPTPTPSPVKKTKKSANVNSAITPPGYATSPTPFNTPLAVSSKPAEAEKRTGGGCFGLIALLTFLGFLPRKKKERKNRL